MTFDLRSLWDWVCELAGRGRISEFEPIGNPSIDIQAPQAGIDQGVNPTSSKGDVVGSDDEDLPA